MWYICFTTDRPYVYQKYIKSEVYQTDFTNGKGDDSVKESRGQPKTGALKQAIE